MTSDTDYYTAYEWAERCFGTEQMQSPQIRALRTVEEVVEFAQAAQVPKDKLHLVIDTVYSRPVGNPLQELGGVMLTATLLCMTMGIHPDKAFGVELKRVLSKSRDHFAKRNQEKDDLGLTTKTESER